MTESLPDATVVAEPIAERMSWRDRIARAMGGDAWTIGLAVTFVALYVFTLLLRPAYGLEALVTAALPVAFAAAGQAIVVISGGIDLSIGSVITLTNVISAVLLLNAPELSVPIVLAVLLIGIGVGVVNGTLVVISRVPDIVVTLAMLFVWAGAALLVLPTPGGESVQWLDDLIDGGIVVDAVPRALVVLLVIVGLVWIPLRRSRLGLSLYAIGSNQLAAFRSGVNVGRTKVVSYGFAGLFAAFGGLALTASTGVGQPVPGPYLLLSVAAIVLGGVSLAGGRGGLLGPIIGIFILGLIRADMLFLDVPSAFSTVIQGVIMVAVVMLGAFVTLRRRTA
jgi:ribose transport system permease protein